MSFLNGHPPPLKHWDEKSWGALWYTGDCREMAVSHHGQWVVVLTRKQGWGEHCISWGELEGRGKNSQERPRTKHHCILFLKQWVSASVYNSVQILPSSRKVCKIFFSCQVKWMELVNLIWYQTTFPFKDKEIVFCNVFEENIFCCCLSKQT